MLKQVFNYYMVLKSCWIILLFHLVGYVALVVMEQGKDILQSLSFTGQGLLVFHTWFALFAAGWWGWQSWRASRVILHFTTFDFVQFNSRYAIRAQVLIPRILGIIPLLIFAYGLVVVSGWSNPLVYVNICLALWLYVLFHLRKDIIILFLSRNKWKLLNIPDYIKVKNEAYPAQFIWKKQGRWILFRLFVITILFSMVVLSPVRFSQLLGSASIVLYALGSWLIIATFLDFAEKRFRFPFTFTIVAMFIGFSFFNNNHKIRTLDKLKAPRKNINGHFANWYTARANDGGTVQVYLVAGQGGGVRSAYWLAQVLGDIHQTYPEFDKHTYAYSSVSGGSLGVATYKQLLRSRSLDLANDAHNILSKDFLAPVTSWLVMPTLIQKFLPFPIYKLDRAKALEYSWEHAAILNDKSLLSDGFMESFQNDDCVYLFNSTRVENGFRTLLSNVKADKKIFSLSEDFFEVTDRDVPLSTAVSVSSRFPFITPPGLVYDKNGKKWGHLVDGGYVENMGATAMLELYDYLRKISNKNGYKVKFNLVFVKNTKVEYKNAITGMHEVLGPLNTFNKVWVNSGYYDENNTKLNNLYHGDKASFISLDRSEDQIIPLGWYLSPQATASMRAQVSSQTQMFKEELHAIFRQ
ncbi:patatin-like phospholipase family protein [Bacteroidia bacterium]|nr:patatin-like phospholipase family protein [Bacteroidia bacterium]